MTRTPPRRIATGQATGQITTQLEQQLWQQLGLEQQLVNIEQVRQFLPAGSALPEFKHHRIDDTNKPAEQRWDDERYFALLLQPDGSLRSNPLQPKYASPLVWAAFQLTGDWRPLP